MQQIKQIKRGFTLVELLLAILLMGILALFVFSQPGEYQQNSQEITIKNLPEAFQKNLKGDGELVCIKKCSECYYLTDVQKPQTAPLPFPLKVQNEYILDKNGNPVKINLGRLNDKKVCFRLEHYKNNSISPVIVELENDKFIFISSFFKEGKEFDSLNEAAAYWLKDSDGKFRSRSEWY